MDLISSDMWNVVDFITNSLYVATIALRLVAYYDVNIFFVKKFEIVIFFLKKSKYFKLNLYFILDKSFF